MKSIRTNIANKGGVSPGILSLCFIFLFGFALLSSRPAWSSCNGNACPVCGDGILCDNPALCDPLEACDDGNNVTETCDRGEESCEVCNADCQLVAGVTSFCGDGILQDEFEECDDGNNNDGDGCDANCDIEKVCGDGIINNDEECDVGQGAGDTCGDDEQCVNAGLDGECTCKLCPRCGNGQIDDGEICDDGNNTSGDDCENDCTLPFCGNGVVDEGEECDAAISNSNSGLCTSECTLNDCGDGFLLIGAEACDDGNNIDHDGCSADCQVCPTVECGDGILEDQEACDVGNGNDDTCDPGTVCNANTCTCETTPQCGDEDKNGDEECDETDQGDDSCDEGEVCEDCTCVPENECPENHDGPPDCDPEHKSLVCHVPPGNPGNEHTICIDNHALNAHFNKHGGEGGDHLGACEEECPGDGNDSALLAGVEQSAASGCSLRTGWSGNIFSGIMLLMIPPFLSWFFLRRRQSR